MVLGTRPRDVHAAHPAADVHIRRDADVQQPMSEARRRRLLPGGAQHDPHLHRRLLHHNPPP